MELNITGFGEERSDMNYADVSCYLNSSSCEFFGIFHYKTWKLNFSSPIG